MRPEDKRIHKQQYGKSRARLFLKKNLGWLPGFPLSVAGDTVRWQSWPWGLPGKSQIVMLDRKALRRAEMTLNKLRNHFPRALPEVVEDVEDWLARMDGLLVILKGVIHRQSSLDVEALLTVSPRSARWVQHYRRLRATQPKLIRLFDALAFLELTDRTCCDTKLLTWIEDHALAFVALMNRGDIALSLQLMFCILYEDMDANLLLFLLAVLSEERFYSIPLGKAYRDYFLRLAEELENAMSGQAFKIPLKPAADPFGDYWEKSLVLLLEMKPKRRQRVTKLLGLMVSADLLSSVHHAIEPARRQEVEFLRLLRRIQFEGVPSNWKRATKKERKQFLNFRGDWQAFRSHEKRVAALQRILSHGDHETHLKVWIRFLECFTAETSGLLVDIFMAWDAEWDRYGHDARAKRRLHQVMAVVTDLFARRGLHDRLLRHWSDWSDPTMILFYDRRDIGPMIKRWVRLLESAIYDRELAVGPRLLSSFCDFACATDDIRRSIEIVAGLAKQEKDVWYREESIKATLAITDDSASIVPVLKQVNGGYDLDESVLLLGEHLQEKRLRLIVTRLLIRNRTKAFSRLFAGTQMLVSLGLPIPTVPRLESAIDESRRYPDELKDSLRDLHGITANAGAIAAKILRQECPGQEALYKEAAVLREKLNDVSAQHDGQLLERLQKRLRNLETRMDRMPQITPPRLAKLEQKIRDRTDREVIEAHIRECQTLVVRTLRERYGLVLPMERLSEPPNDRLLSGILALEGSMRKLGLRVLIKSVEEPTCDFRTEARNVAFLENIRQKGINVQPWLDRSLHQEAVTSGGEPYRLSFAHRIDDILQMGLHFGTCLSPHETNFFSTITNAVDINKQVLYGKTESGRVIGRCLFALSDNGTLLTYHRYTHDPKGDFQEQVEEFAQRLARAMNTVLVASAHVSTLVAQTWYDDGAISFASQYNLEHADGLVRTTLRWEPLSKVIERLVGIVGSGAMLKGLLGSLLSMEEFYQRPEIVLPFLDRFAFDPTVPFQDRMRLAVLASRAGKMEMASQIVKRFKVHTLPPRLKCFSGFYGMYFNSIGDYTEVYDLLIACNPSIALRTLRKTRPRNVKSDAEETIPVRKEILARCYQALGRGV